MQNKLTSYANRISTTFKTLTVKTLYIPLFVALGVMAGVELLKQPRLLRNIDSAYDSAIDNAVSYEYVNKRQHKHSPQTSPNPKVTSMFSHRQRNYDSSSRFSRLNNNL